MSNFSGKKSQPHVDYYSIVENKWSRLKIERSFFISGREHKGIQNVCIYNDKQIGVNEREGSLMQHVARISDIVDGAVSDPLRVKLVPGHNLAV